jgi:hypothetical protein
VNEDASEEERGRYFVGQLIREWNLRPVDDPDGEPLPVPASAADIDRLPAMGGDGRSLPREDSEDPKLTQPRAEGRRG